MFVRRRGRCRRRRRRRAGDHGRQLLSVRLMGEQVCFVRLASAIVNEFETDGGVVAGGDEPRVVQYVIRRDPVAENAEYEVGELFGERKRGEQENVPVARGERTVGAERVVEKVPNANADDDGPSLVGFVVGQLAVGVVDVDPFDVKYGVAHDEHKVDEQSDEEKVRETQETRIRHGVHERDSMMTIMCTISGVYVVIIFYIYF